MEFTFESFIDGSFDYDPVSQTHTSLWLREENMDIGGGRIRIEDIDRLREFPEAEVVTISGLRQDTFAYFIQTYGKQLKAIRFFKNKFVEDLSLLGTLPQLEYVHFFFNQRVTSLWDMRENRSLKGLCLEDFSRLHSIEQIQTAPALQHFEIGNAIWSKMVLDSLLPLAGTKIAHFGFSGKGLLNDDLSFLSEMPHLKTFDFSTNFYTTEQVAWIAANFPRLEGYALKAKLDFPATEYTPESTYIVGKRKPCLPLEGNEARIQKYVDAFEALKKRYRGVPYREAFPQ